jgi:hypothetical protein
MAGLAWVLPMFLICSVPLLSAQMTQSSTPMSRDYRGVDVRIGGIFVTPVPNAPFSATVQIVSHDKLPDGSEHVVTTVNHIARASSGRIYNERRRLVLTSFQGDPPLLSAHIYDPSSRLSIFLDPQTRLARETVLPAPEAIPVTARPPAQRPTASGVVQTELGGQSLGGVELKGYRKVLTVPATSSGTGKEIEVVDEYWYSPELSIYLIIRHNDPRTGEQMVAVSKVERAEPSAELFAVPPNYKVVDETPPESPAAAR